MLCGSTEVQNLQVPQDDIEIRGWVFITRIPRLQVLPARQRGVRGLRVVPGLREHIRPGQHGRVPAGPAGHCAARSPLVSTRVKKCVRRIGPKAFRLEGQKKKEKYIYGSSAQPKGISRVL